MPNFVVMSPDGRKFNITAPDGATQDDAIAYAQKNLSSTPSAAPAVATAPAGDLPESSTGAFVNRAIANNLGMFVNTANAALNATATTHLFPDKPVEPPLPADASTFAKVARGLNDIIPGAPNLMGIPGAIMRGSGYQQNNNPILGSKNIADLMSAAGAAMPRPDEQPKSLYNQIAEGVGNAAGALIPMGAGAKIASMAAPGLASGIGEAMLTSVAEHPVQMIGADLASGVTSGIGGAVGENIAPDNPTAKTIGQIVGGFSPTSRALNYLMNKSGGAITAATFPFTQTGAEINAANRVKSLVPDAESAATALDQPTIVPLRPAQQLGDERTLALENAVRKENVGVDEKFRQQDQSNLDELNNQMNTIKGDGNVGDTQAALSDRKSQLSDLLDLRLQQASQKTDDAISKLDPNLRGSQASIIARNELESALGDARTQEKQLWNDIPDNILVDKNNTTDTYNQILKNTPRAQQDDIPKALMSKVLNNSDVVNSPIVNSRGERMIGDNMPVTERVSELQGLRSKLLEGSRQARADGNFNSARIHDELANAVLNDIGAAPDRVQGPIGQKIRDALDFSRTLNDKFTRGEVGRVLGTTSTGASRVAPEMTLSSVVGAGKIKGDVGVQQMLDAADTPELRGSIEDHLKEQLGKAAIKEGVVNPAAARKFMNDNVDILNKFPDLKQSISNAADSADSLVAQSARVASAKKVLTSDSKNQVSKFINAPIDKEFDVIVGSRDPAGFTKDLINRVSKDPSGAAAKGLKASAVDYVMKKSMQGGALNGEMLLNNLNNNKRLNDAISQVLTPDELQRMKRIGGEIKAVQATSTKDIGGVINNSPGVLTSTPIRLIALNAGKKVGKFTGNMPIATGNIFAKRASNFTNNLTNDKATELLTQAVQDKQLYKALLTDTTTKPGQKMAAQRMEAWLLGPGSTLLDAEDKKNQ